LILPENPTGTALIREQDAGAVTARKICAPVLCSQMTAMKQL
jgi:hypothetical protein